MGVILVWGLVVVYSRMGVLLWLMVWYSCLKVMCMGFWVCDRLFRCSM